MVQKDIFAEEALDPGHFRVVVFGSSRTVKDSPLFKQVYKFGEVIADMGFDIVTGGGPGVMEAANTGHQDRASELLKAGRNGHVHSFGINIKLPFEQRINPGVKISHEYQRFSARLDEFMSLANVIVIFPGGVGTQLELFYTWQLIQVQHMCHIPIILVGDKWDGLLKWLRDVPMNDGLFTIDDFKMLKCVKDSDEAITAIKKWHKLFVEEGGDVCLNWKKYKI
ncbi:MAG: LOG family protein [Candidatus Peregrinibacteria bacterium]|nr:LOG family protein [Candidatus Peregrinibacteria bacterium]